MASIIINTTAVRNNGDVALLSALEKALESRGHTVLIATPHPGVMADVQNRHNACGEVLGYKFPAFRYPALSDAAALSRLLSSSAYRDADAIIGAPGGYINSYYGFNWRLAVFRWAAKLGKRTGIYAQSIGPLNDQDKSSLSASSKYLDVLMTRDPWSERVALDAGFPQDKILPSVDAIFLNKPSQSAASSDSNTIGVSAREWPYDNRNRAAYIKLVSRLSQMALDSGCSIDFLSTCQGIPGYIDDSRIAREIANDLQGRYANHSINVDSGAHCLDHFVARLPSYRFVIGTRLHMCLLSLLAGVPAFNISYEMKGKECYKYLGMEDYSVDYNEPLPVAEGKFASFIRNYPMIQANIAEAVERQHRKAVYDFDLFMRRLDLA